MSSHFNVNETLLATGTTIKQYREFEAARDKVSLAEFVYKRFYERYVAPIESSRKKNGFAIMAVSCLMIEALMSFRLGFKDTKARGQGKECFRMFFISVPTFSEFSDIYCEFYDCVRCGILHQAETKGGWKILRRDALLDKSNRIINAEKFLDGLKSYLADYTKDLTNSEWDSDIWVQFKKKMNAVIDNCGGTI